MLAEKSSLEATVESLTAEKTQLTAENEAHRLNALKEVEAAEKRRQFLAKWLAEKKSLETTVDHLNGQIAQSAAENLKLSRDITENENRLQDLKNVLESKGKEIAKLAVRPWAISHLSL